MLMCPDCAQIQLIINNLKDFDRATKSLFTVFCSFHYVVLEFPVSGATIAEKSLNKLSNIIFHNL